MIKSGGYKDERAEILIELLEGALQEKDTKLSECQKHLTTLQLRMML